MRQPAPTLDMPRQRRQLWLALTFMLVVAGFMILLPVWRETRLVSALQEQVAAGLPFRLDTAADFDWTKVCIVPSGTPEGQVASLLGLAFPPAVRNDGLSMMVFFDGAGIMAYAEIETPAYAGDAICLNAEEQVQVVPGRDTGGATFLLQRENT